MFLNYQNFKIKLIRKYTFSMKALPPPCSSSCNKGRGSNVTQCDDVPAARNYSYIAVKEKERADIKKDTEFPIDE